MYARKQRLQLCVLCVRNLSKLSTRSAECVVITDFYAKTRAWEGAPQPAGAVQLLIQLAAFALVIKIFFLFFPLFIEKTPCKSL